jgi:hypothetical protein
LIQDRMIVGFHANADDFGGMSGHGQTPLKGASGKSIPCLSNNRRTAFGRPTATEAATSGNHQ